MPIGNGTARLVDDPTEKVRALHAFTDHIVPGRWQDVRPPTESELRATTVLRLSLVEVSAKVRTGPPIDDEEDYQLPVWAGVVPLTIRAGRPIDDERLNGIEPPDYARNYSRTLSGFNVDR